MENAGIFFIGLTLWVSAWAAGTPDIVWTARYNNNSHGTHDISVNGAAADKDGNIFSVGEANPGIFILKSDGGTGDSLWAKVYHSPGDPAAALTGCATDSQGFLYAVGFEETGDGFAATAMKIDPNSGEALWARTYGTKPGGNVYAAACATDRQGNLYLVGTCAEDTLNSYHYNRYHPLVVKYDAATGDTVWVRHLESADDTIAEALGCAVDSAGYLYYVGYSMAAAGTAWLVAKLDPATGGTIWRKRLDWMPISLFRDNSASCCALGNGNSLYVAGVQASISTVLKLSTDTGDTLWMTVDTLPSYYRIIGCAVDTAGDLYCSSMDMYNRTLKVVKYHAMVGSSEWVSNAPWFADGYYSGSVSCAIGNEELSIHASVRSWWGSTDSLPAAGLMIFRMDPSTGDSIWVRRRMIGDFGFDFGRACAADSDQVYLMGTSNMTAMTMACDNATGQIQWARRYPQDQAGQPCKGYSIARGGDGAVYVAGAVWDEGMFTTRYGGADGQQGWIAQRDFYEAVFAGDLALGPDGSLYTNATTCYWEEIGLLVKRDPTAGDTIWAHSFYLNTTCCMVDDNGFVYVAGPTGLLKCEPVTGDTVYARVSYDLGAVHDCACGASGSVFVVGNRYPNVLIAKFDAASGDTIWTRTYHDPTAEEQGAFGCAVDDSGSLYVAGYRRSAGGDDMLVLKCDTDGDTLWSFVYDGPAGGDDLARGCAVDPFGYLYVTGSSSVGRHYDMVTLKLNTKYLGIGGRDLPTPPAPVAFGVARPWPNPAASGGINLRYTLPVTAMTSVSVYNAAGQLVRTLWRGEQPAGPHLLRWDGRTADNRRAAAGVYFINVRSGDRAGPQKLILVR